MTSPAERAHLAPTPPSQLRVSDLQTLVALRAHRSVRAVARVMGTTPGAASKALKRLELTSGRALLKRRPGQIALNPHGHALAERIEPLIAALTQLRALKPRATQ